MEQTDIPMERNDIPVESVKIPKKSTPKKTRVARCLDCTHEWYANNGNDAKPVRCGACGSRNVMWRDECSDTEVKPEEKNMESDSLHMETQGNDAVLENSGISDSKIVESRSLHMETRRNKAIPKKSSSKKRKIEPAAVSEEYTGGHSVEYPAVESKPTLESIEKSMPKIPMQAIVFIIGGMALIAAILFLRRKGKEQHIARMQKIQQAKKPSLAEDMLRRNCGIGA